MPKDLPARQEGETEQQYWDRVLRTQKLGTGRGRSKDVVLAGSAEEAREAGADDASRSDFTERRRDAARYDQQHPQGS